MSYKLVGKNTYRLVIVQQKLEYLEIFASTVSKLEEEYRNICEYMYSKLKSVISIRYSKKRM